MLGANVAMYVFSTVDRQSFDDLPKWQLKVTAECGPIQQMLVQSKTDLMDREVMTREEVESMAAKLGVRVFRASAKQNTNVLEGKAESAVGKVSEVLGSHHVLASL